MSVQLNLILFVLAIVLSLILGPRLHTNIGIIAILFAFIIGVWLNGMAVNDIISLWPTRLMFIIMSANFFFSYMNRSGAVKGIADRIMYKSRNIPWAIPIVLFFATYVVCSLGGGLSATPFIMSPIAFALASEMGFAPVIAAAACFCATGAGSNWFWTADGAMNVGMATQFITNGDTQEAINVSLKSAVANLIACFIMFMVVYLLSKGFKISNKNAVNIKKPEPFTEEQKSDLGVLAAFIILAILPLIINTFLPNPVTAWMKKNLDVQILIYLFAIFMAFRKGKEIDIREVITKDVPWGMLVMICGMGTLVSLCNPLGIVEFLRGVAQNAPSNLIVPALALICALLTMVTSGYVVVMAIYPVVPALAGITGLTPAGLYICLGLAASLPGISPFSTGGSMSLVGCYDENQRSKVVQQQIKYSFVGAILSLLLAVSGFYKLF